jgi:hypothetical protein
LRRYIGADRSRLWKRIDLHKRPPRASLLPLTPFTVTQLLHKRNEEIVNSFVVESSLDPIDSVSFLDGSGKKEGAL